MFSLLDPSIILVGLLGSMYVFSFSDKCASVSVVGDGAEFIRLIRLLRAENFILRRQGTLLKNWSHTTNMTNKMLKIICTNCTYWLRLKLNVDVKCISDVPVIYLEQMLHSLHSLHIFSIISAIITTNADKSKGKISEQADTNRSRRKIQRVREQ